MLFNNANEEHQHNDSSLNIWQITYVWLFTVITKALVEHNNTVFFRISIKKNPTQSSSILQIFLLDSKFPKDNNWKETCKIVGIKLFLPLSLCQFYERWLSNLGSCFWNLNFLNYCGSVSVIRYTKGEF